MTAFSYPLGVHVSIAGGIDKAVERALELGCSAMQIFSRNPRGWGASPLDIPRARLFREKVRRSKAQCPDGTRPITLWDEDE